jgi:hypothetical protein
MAAARREGASRQAIRDCRIIASVIGQAGMQGRSFRVLDELPGGGRHLRVMARPVAGDEPRREDRKVSHTWLGIAVTRRGRGGPGDQRELPFSSYRFSSSSRSSAAVRTMTGQTRGTTPDSRAAAASSAFPRSKPEELRAGDRSVPFPERGEELPDDRVEPLPGATIGRITAPEREPEDHHASRDCAADPVGPGEAGAEPAGDPAGRLRREAETVAIGLADRLRAEGSRLEEGDGSLDTSGFHAMSVGGRRE